jgi:hypothetical protein
VAQRKPIRVQLRGGHADGQVVTIDRLAAFVSVPYLRGHSRIGPRGGSGQLFVDRKRQPELYAFCSQTGTALPVYEAV